MKTFLKKQQGFTLIELMITVAIIGILASIAIGVYQDRMTKSKWAKTIANVRALKLAVENCLSDNAGAFSQCDALVQGKIAAYGVTQYAAANGEFLSIDLIPNVAAIKIMGDEPLAYCILTISPSYSAQVGMITWDYAMTSTNSSFADIDKCRSFVKGSTAS